MTSDAEMSDIVIYSSNSRRPYNGKWEDTMLALTLF